MLNDAFTNTLQTSFQSSLGNIGSAPAPTYDSLKIAVANVTAEMRINSIILHDEYGDNFMPVQGTIGADANDFTDVGTNQATHTSSLNSGNRGCVISYTGPVRSETADGGLDFYIKFDEARVAPARIYITFASTHAYLESIVFTAYSEGEGTVLTPTAEPSGDGDLADEMTSTLFELYRWDFSDHTTVTIPAAASGTGNLDSVIAGVCGEYDTTKTASFDPDTDATLLNNLTATPALGESVVLYNGIDAGTRLDHSGTKGTTTSTLVMTDGTEFLYHDELNKSPVLSNWGRTDLDYMPFFVMCGKWNDDGVQKYIWGSGEGSASGTWAFLGTSQNLHVQQSISNAVDITLIQGDVVPDFVDFCMVVSYDFATGNVRSAINADTYTATSTTFNENILSAYQETSNSTGNYSGSTTGGKFGVCAGFQGATAGGQTFRKNVPLTWEGLDEFKTFAWGASSSLLENADFEAIMDHYRTEHGKAYT